MENLALFEEKIPYSVKKLIAVNSITYCYIELEIDRYCALFGRNNVGKTSLLNALKLHFFLRLVLMTVKISLLLNHQKVNSIPVKIATVITFLVIAAF